jgi:hypothetical protein
MLHTADYERLLARADDVDAGTQIIRIWAVVPSWVRSVTLSRQMRWEADLPDPGDRPKLHAAPVGDGVLAVVGEHRRCGVEIAEGDVLVADVDESCRSLVIPAWIGPAASYGVILDRTGPGAWGCPHLTG